MEQALHAKATEAPLRFVGAVRSFRLDGRRLTLETDGAQVHVTVLAPDLVRVQMVPDVAAGRTVLDSLAVVKHEWEPVAVELEEEAHRLTLRAAGGRGAGAGAATGVGAGAGAAAGVGAGAGAAAGAGAGVGSADREGAGPATGAGAFTVSGGLTVEIQREPLRLRIVRGDGSVAAACADEGGLAWDDERVHWRMAAPAGVRYYGFGQKQGFLDKRGKKMSLWATDEPLHILEHDELYQAIPFFMTLEQGTGRSAGVFLDCTGRVDYDVAKSDAAVMAMSGAGPVLDAYVFAGPHPKHVIGRYTELTGRMELPPLWALGYQQCRYSYYPEARVREIAREMRERGIPCDVIYLDIDYMDGYRVFTWDKERFPDPKKLVSDLAEDGFRTVVIIDPGVKLDAQYEVFKQGIAGGHFICRPDGEPFVGTVWPGNTVFPDFLRAETRAWWGELHRELLEDVGVAGIWNDMNEPSCFARNTLPDDVLQGEDGAKVPHAAVHNVYGLTMTMATMEGWRRINPDKRPFLLTRSGYAGVQRYAAVWMGDNHSWWEHLLMSIPMCLGMGLSGVPFVGVDIGGFSHDAEAEMFARWMQVGAFMPFCRNHSAKFTADQEPWVFGPAVEEISREYLRLRYALLPYLYNLFREASVTGLPIMRPLLLEYPDDENVVNLSDQFLLGRDLLVCPVYQPDATHRMVYLPPGTWVDFWTGQRLAGGRHIVAEAPLERMPLYVRDGAVLPMEPPVNHVGERDGKHLTLHVYAGEDGRFELYEDAGEGYGYRRGEWSLTAVDVRRTANGVVVAVADPVSGAEAAPVGAAAVAAVGGAAAEAVSGAAAGEAGFRPPREQVTVHLHLRGAEFSGTPAVMVDGAEVVLREVDGRLVGEAGQAGEKGGAAGDAGPTGQALPGVSPGAAGDVIVTVPTPQARGFTLTVEYR